MVHPMLFTRSSCPPACCTPATHTTDTAHAAARATPAPTQLPPQAAHTTSILQGYGYTHASADSCSKMHTLVGCGDGQHATIQALSRTMRLRRGRISKLKPLGSAPLRGARTHALAPHNMHVHA